jgi:glycosyltransferase involved in cell wall biosynthesis
VSDAYRRPYVEGSVYSNVVDLVGVHRASGGKVVVDLGCGFGAIAEPIRDLGLEYVGLDQDSRSVQDLMDRGFEAKTGNLADPRLVLPLIESVLDGRPLAAITVIDFLDHITTGPALLDLLHTLSMSNGRPPLVLSVPNATHFDIAAKMLIGRFDYMPTGLIEETHVVFYSPDHLDRVMASSSWIEAGRSDFELSRSDQHFPENVPVLTRGTPIHRLLFQMRDQAAEGAIVNQFVRAYSPADHVVEVAEDTETDPFLSVLVRTQGRRRSTLVETLLSLAAQTSQDFEVVILAHDMKEAELEELSLLVESFDTDFTARVRIVRVEGGGRARPLNVGVQRARGAYVAVLDDDDIAFAHWVEEFHRSASANPGTAIRTLVAEQPIEATSWDGSSGYTTIGSTAIPFPDEFDLWAHLFENYSPFCGYAIPRSCFTDMGVHFDETLAVVEDWDVILETALLCGVTNNPDVTSLYRRWQSTHSSFAVHSKDEWHRAREKVLARFDQRTLPMPPGTLSDYHRLYEELAMRRKMTDHLIFERNHARDESSGRGEEISNLAGRLHTTTMERNLAIGQAERTQSEIERMHATMSWKITKPVRGFRQAVGRLIRPHR